jgi:hypothetical protein
VRNYGLLHEAELIPRSYGGNSWFAKFTPAAGKELLSSLPVIVRGLLRGKLNPKIAIFGHKIPKDDLKAVQSIYEKIEGREQRYELNLYIAGEDESAQVDASDAVAVGVGVEPGGKAPEASSGAEPGDASGGVHGSEGGTS